MRRIWGGATLTTSNIPNDPNNPKSGKSDGSASPLSPLGFLPSAISGTSNGTSRSYWGSKPSGGKAGEPNGSDGARAFSSGQEKGGAEGSSDTSSMLDLDDLKLPFGAAPSSNAFKSNSLDSGSVSSLSTTCTEPSTSLADAKDDLLVELLGSQAEIESREFEILSWEEVEELKRELNSITNRITALSHKITLETRLRDAAVTLSRLPSSSTEPAYDSASRRASLEEATRKVDDLSSQLWQLGRREADIRDRILRHIAAVLGVVVRKKEERPVHQGPSIPKDSNASSSFRSPPLSASTDRRTPSPALTDVSNGLRARDTLRFEAAQFYANNKNASSPSMTSTIRSPGNCPMDKMVDDVADSAELLALQTQNDALQASLSHAQTSLSQAQTQAAEAESALLNLQIDVEGLQSRLASAENKTTELEEDLTRSREEGSEEIREYQRKLEELDKTFSESEARAQSRERDLQERLEQTSTETSQQGREMIETLNAVISRRRMDQGPIGDLLRQEWHEEAVSEPSALASALEGFIIRASDLFENLEKELSAAQASHSAEQRRTDDEIDRIRGEHSRGRMELKDVSKERDDLAVSHKQLESRFAELEEAASEVKALKEQVLAATNEEVKARSLLGSVQDKVADLEKALSESTTRQEQSSRVFRDIWLQLPASDVRAKVTDSNDLKTFKAAFESSRKPFGSFALDLSAAPKYSIESFVDRVRNLLADDKKLLEKLIKAEEEEGYHKAEADKAKQMAQTGKASLDEHQKKLRELEERAEVSAAQEVKMLDRLNDLQASLENLRIEKRKLEATISTLTAQVKELESAKARTEDELTQTRSELSKRPDDSEKVAQLDAELQEAKELLRDTQDEFDDMRNREQKQRITMLDELNNLQQEASNLRSQLRQAQRSKGR